MRQYELLVDAYNPVDFAPENDALEIMQNVRTILATPKYSVPLFREFGVEDGLTDTPINTAGAKLKSEIIMAVRKYEPRAEISYIEFVPDDNGKLSLRIRITI